MKEAGVFPSNFIKPRGKDYEWINRRELEIAFKALMSLKINDRQIKQKINFIFNINIFTNIMRFKRMQILGGRMF